MALLEARHVTTSVARYPREVYAFLANPENMPRWASGLGDEMHREGDAWVAKGPLGTIRVKFTPKNALGVVDHDVTLESGQTVHNPLRVLANGEAGSEVVFTLFRQPGVSDADVEKDQRHIEKDLRSLKALLEAKADLEGGA